jgi:hypothetical protein
MRIRVPGLPKIGLLVLLGCAAQSQAQVIYNAFNDFYVNVPATGGAGDYPQTTWIANGGSTAPNAWGYAGGNFNGVGAPSTVGTYVSGGNFYALTSGGTYAGPGVSYNLGGGNYWIGYNDQYGIVGLPNARTQIGKYTTEWFSGTPNYTSSPGGLNNKYLWLQGTKGDGLLASNDGMGALLTWTAPTSGTFQISGSYVNGNYGPSTSFAIVDSLGSSLLSRQVLAPSATEATFSFTKTYSAGDVIQFQVGTPAANTQGSPLGLAVNIIPEPSSGALLAAGLGALGLVRLRRRA